MHNQPLLKRNPLGHCIYLKEIDYEWWFNRIAAASKLFDILRIDHFRAFDTFYAIPYPAENAIGGDCVVPDISMALEVSILSQKSGKYV